MKHALSVMCCLALACGAWAQQSPPEDAQAAHYAAERTRIRQSRVQEETRFAAEERQCYRKFAVNDCLLEVRKRKRELLGDLRRQEISLNDAERKRRGAEQLLRADERSARPSP